MTRSSLSNSESAALSELDSETLAALARRGCGVETLTKKRVTRVDGDGDTQMGCMGVPWP